MKIKLNILILIYFTNFRLLFYKIIIIILLIRLSPNFCKMN